jgi:putative DNA methylase
MPNVEWISKAIDKLAPFIPSEVLQVNANAVDYSGTQPIISTDPPYYDNIGYADLSDFFYVWLRRSLRSVYSGLFRTLLVPKAEELVATPYRHGTKEKAEFFSWKA